MLAVRNQPSALPNICHHVCAHSAPAHRSLSWAEGCIHIASIDKACSKLLGEVCYRSRDVYASCRLHDAEACRGVVMTFGAKLQDTEAWGGDVLVSCAEGMLL
jgi:hypothetical protein